MAENSLDKINRSIEYIEEHIKDTLTLDGVSKESGLSVFHLHRLFRSLTGYPLANYIRARKLSLSIGELLETSLSILDVAVEYGFEYQQSYCRAFKNLFGVSPTQFRDGKGSLAAVTRKLDTSGLKEVGEGVLQTPKYVVKTGFNLVGIRELVADEENFLKATANEMGVTFYHQKSLKIPNNINPQVYYGLIEDIPGKQNENWYHPSVEVSDLSQVPQGMHGISVPTRRYAVFTYIGFHAPEEITFKTICELYYNIFAIWLPQSGETKNDGYHFERIDKALCNNGYCQMDIYIPLSGIAPA